MKCRSVEQLTQLSISPSTFYTTGPIVSLHNYNCIDNPASYTQSLFQTPQR